MMVKMILPSGSNIYYSPLPNFPGNPIIKVSTRKRKVDIPEDYKEQRIEVTGGYCNLSDLIQDTTTNTSKTAKSPTKTRKIPFKQKFKNGSVWKVIKDCIIEIQEEGIVWPSKDIKVYLKKGDLIKPIGKAVDHCYIPIEVQNYKKYKTVISGKVVDIEYKFRMDLHKDIENYIECIQEAPQSKSYYLKIDEEFYVNFDYPNLTTTTVLKKAKKFKTQQAIRGSILSNTGYYDGMEDVPYWFSGDKNKSIDYTNFKSLSIVEFDKENISIKNEEDILPWLNNTFKYRNIILEYGSSIKEIIKEIEDGIVFEQIMIFRSTINGLMSSLVDPSEVEKLTLELKSLFSGSDYKKKSGSNSVAVGFKSEEDATMFKLSYSGKLHVELFDLKKMKKVE